ncbi:YigZ family protein [Mucilaginibacter sp. SG564]|uniref:IMPACT family protein n=1 Tax=Mucilaginibacter sp. SG564 TaxID=2587022 RepID=UPI0015520832|nr:YigZ family protein [Mucilaginibacter sp. SG564]NOW93480.1 putative YigZ family protein [Mucilaginibacter sp. SG564]
MLFDDTYKTIEQPTEGIFRDRGSKFLAYAYPINSENDIKGIITNLKAEHPKANHHCWAMRLSIDRGVFRVNDDGEPSGTAGRPILNTLLSHDLTNLIVVVVRYFGGTLLGVPGLINAYKVATEEALNQATIIHKTVNDIYTISFDYLQMNDVMRVIKDDNLAILHQQFDNDCRIQVSIRKTQVEQTLFKISKVSGAVAKYDHSL